MPRREEPVQNEDPRASQGRVAAQYSTEDCPQGLPVDRRGRAEDRRVGERIQG